jgi:hypothetical protein
MDNILALSYIIVFLLILLNFNVVLKSITWSNVKKFMKKTMLAVSIIVLGVASIGGVSLWMNSEEKTVRIIGLTGTMLCLALIAKLFLLMFRRRKDDE